MHGAYFIYSSNITLFIVETSTDAVLSHSVSFMSVDRNILI